MWGQPGSSNSGRGQLDNTHQFHCIATSPIYSSFSRMGSRSNIAISSQQLSPSQRPKEGNLNVNGYPSGSRLGLTHTQQNPSSLFHIQIWSLVQMMDLLSSLITLKGTSISSLCPPVFKNPKVISLGISSSSIDIALKSLIVDTERDSSLIILNMEDFTKLTQTSWLISLPFVSYLFIFSTSSPLTSIFRDYDLQLPHQQSQAIG